MKSAVKEYTHTKVSIPHMYRKGSGCDLMKVLWQHCLGDLEKPEDR